MAYNASNGAQTYVPTVVVGGSQAGLTMGYHLRRAGMTFVILEADHRVGDAWRRRWDSLRLFSPPRYASLPGWPIPVRGFPTKDEMADYLEAYARRFDLPVHTGARVDRLSRTNGHFVLHTQAGSVVTDQVVLATGGYQRPVVPAFAGELRSNIVQVHSHEYYSPAQLAPGPVLLVGAGNSGAEIALDAARAGHQVVLAGRHPGQIPFPIDSMMSRLALPVVMFMFRRVLTLDTPMGRKARQPALDHGTNLVRTRLEDLDAAGVVRVSRITGVSDGWPTTEDGEVLRPSSVVWCTGYRPDYGWVDLPLTGPDGHPVHNRGVSRIPGLFFLGLEFQYSLASATIQGLNQDARHLVRALRSTAAVVPATEPLAVAS